MENVSQTKLNRKPNQIFSSDFNSSSLKIRAKGNALIIFDVMGFVHNFGKTKTELHLGGRQHIYLRDFELFLIELRKLGARVAFFCDGQLQSDKNDEWCRRRDTEFQDTFKMINPNLDHDDQCKRRIGCKTIAKSLLKLVEDKRYGKVMISTQVDCDAAIAKVSKFICEKYHTIIFIYIKIFTLYFSLKVCCVKWSDGHCCE